MYRLMHTSLNKQRRKNESCATFWRLNAGSLIRNLNDIVQENNLNWEFMQSTPAPIAKVDFASKTNELI